MRFVFPILILFAFSAAAQQGEPEKTGMKLPPSTETRSPHAAAGRDLFLNPGGELLLTGFREYDYLEQERSDSLIAFNRMRMDVDFAQGSEEEASALLDNRLAEFNMQLILCGGAEVSLPEFLARFLLQEALQFGYQYARERVRAQSLTEMDYLYLPQGPGVMRTFGEVESAARLQGEMQASRVWRDYYESRKNKISLK
jgi:hypothetical protein